MTKNEEIIAMLEILKEQVQTPFTLGVFMKKDTIIKNVSKDSFIFVINKAIEELDAKEADNDNSNNNH